MYGLVLWFSGSGFRIWSLGIRVEGSWVLRVWGFRIWGFQASGFGVQDLRPKPLA